VNLSNLTLYVKVTDLAFGGGFTIDRSFNQDDARSSGFGPGLVVLARDTITTDVDGSLMLRRGSGRVDRFTSATGASTLFAVTGNQRHAAPQPRRNLHTAHSHWCTRVFE